MRKIIITGGAGLIGQNLVALLSKRKDQEIVVLDKHSANIAALSSRHPEITTLNVDLSVYGDWVEYFRDTDVVVIAHAEIGTSDPSAFYRNNVLATENVLQASQQHSVRYYVHLSSSVVDSVADDQYIETKLRQEQLVVSSRVNCVVLRPTLMYGWFDRKHLGWLSRFMRKSPLFPIPGNGAFIRQPLYAGDFCKIVVGCIDNNIVGTYKITGLEKIKYIDLIRLIKKTINSKTVILKVPYFLFFSLLKIWSAFDKNPPFTVDQLRALVTPDEFEVIDWPSIFSVEPTSLEKGIKATFTDPVYSKIVLDF